MKGIASMQAVPARLCEDRSGLALIEFALSLPLLLTMGMGGIELANQALAAERVQQIAMLVADNAARVRDSIDEVDVNEIMVGAKLVGESIQFSQRGRIILSDVQPNQNATGQWIRWQRCMGAKTMASSYGVEGDGRMTALIPAIGPTGNQIAAMPGSIVMFVEVAYDYQPVVPINLFSGRTMRATAAFNVRQRKAVSDKNPTTGLPLTTPPTDILNSKSLALNKTSSCAYYTS